MMTAGIPRGSCVGAWKCWTPLGRNSSAGASRIRVAAVSTDVLHRARGSSPDGPFGLLNPNQPPSIVASYSNASVDLMKNWGLVVPRHGGRRRDPTFI